MKQHRTEPATGDGNPTVRIWHGRTTLERADAYAEFLQQRAIPDYRSTPGNLAVYVLRRDEPAAAHFVTLTLWESGESIEAFAGSKPLTAKYYPEDADFLLEFEPRVVHYQTVAYSRTEDRHAPQSYQHPDD